MSDKIFISLSEAKVSQGKWDKIFEPKKRKLTKKQISKQLNRYKQGLKINENKM